MPIYEYQCPEHGRFEKYKRTTFPGRGPCPICGAYCYKVMSSSSFQNRDTLEVTYRDQGRRMEVIGRPHD